MSIESFGATSISDVRMLESRYSIQLPYDYLNFLCAEGGGIVRKPNNKVNIKSLRDVITVDVLFGFNTQYINANIDTWTDKYINEMPKDTLIIGDTLEHGFIVLLCSGEDAGVYYWDDTYHFSSSNDSSNTYFITNTFTEFINAIK